MIEFACGNCGKQFSVPDDAAGRQAECRNCQTKMKVPDQSAPAEIVIPPLPDSIWFLDVFGWVFILAATLGGLLGAVVCAANQNTPGAFACLFGIMCGWIGSALMFGFVYCCRVMNRLDPGVKISPSKQTKAELIRQIQGRTD